MPLWGRHKKDHDDDQKEQRDHHHHKDHRHHKGHGDDHEHKDHHKEHHHHHHHHHHRHHKEGFNMQKAIQCFEDSVKEEGILMDEFIEGFFEICKYLDTFGMVFGFVVSDVRDKLRILADYRQGDTKEHYKLVQEMLDYEVEHKLTAHKKKPSGSRTLLRLQRAVEFIALFVARLVEVEPEAKACPIALETYKETLGKHHEWLIRKAVQLGMHTLGHAGSLAERMGGDSYEERVELGQRLAAAVGPMAERMYKFYEERDLLQLP